MTARRVRVCLAERAAPLARHLVDEHDPARGQEFLDIAIAEGETEAQPHRAASGTQRGMVAL